MFKTSIVMLALSALVLGGCGEKKVEPAQVSVAPEAKGPNLTKTPDVGRVEEETVLATGSGVTPGAAVNDALKTAITQVNGATVNASSANLDVYAKATATLDVETSEGKDHAAATSSLQGQSFDIAIVTVSNG